MLHHHQLEASVYYMQARFYEAAHGVALDAQSNAVEAHDA